SAGSSPRQSRSVRAVLVGAVIKSPPPPSPTRLSPWPPFQSIFLRRLRNKRGISNDAGRVKSFFKFFLLPLTEFEHTSSSTHQRRLFLLLLFIGVTLTCSARLHSSTQCCPPNISSITIDHDELFELPPVSGRRVA